MFYTYIDISRGELFFNKLLFRELTRFSIEISPFLSLSSNRLDNNMLHNIMLHNISVLKSETDPQVKSCCCFWDFFNFAMINLLDKIFDKRKFFFETHTSV